MEGASSAAAVWGSELWASPEVVGLGRRPMRSTFYAYPDAAVARSGDRTASPWFVNLEGKWRFHLAPTPTMLPAGFADPGFDDSSWGSVEVPGCWTMQDARTPDGVADLPAYQNVVYPFDCEPPAVFTDRNPTGCYRLRISLPEHFAGRRTILRMGGALSCALIWVNGHPIGAAKDSHLPSDFDLTEYLRPQGEENVLAIACVRWSDASWLEDQDQWWHAGLQREVVLLSEAAIGISDVAVREAAADGSLVVDTAVAFTGVDPEAGWNVSCVLETLDGAAVLGRFTREVPIFDHEQPLMTADRFKGHSVRWRASVDDLVPWSSELPHRYRLLVELSDPQGVVVEVVPLLIGFRTVEIRDRELQINGRPVLFRGVNRHDHDPDRGKAVTMDDIRADLLMIKRNNLNAVRCSHYPADPYLYELCDELGIYVVDEANIETHGRRGSIAIDPQFEIAIFDRMRRMVWRDRNHPSIFSWSLGNEQGYGPIFEGAAAYVHALDPTRIVQHESAHRYPWYEGTRGTTDIACPMYPTIADLERYSAGDDPRPLVMCEFNHAMGNSNGSLADYWEAIESLPGLQGGFIWEWKDHGLTRVEPDGSRRWVVGGGFGEERHDGTFCADGLVGPDRAAHPGLTEVKWLGRPVRVSGAGEGLLRVENRQDFTGTEWLAATWSVTVEGETAASGLLGLPEVPPGDAAVVPYPAEAASVIARAGDREVFLDVEITTAHDTAWAPVGHVVGWDQIAVGGRWTPDPATPQGGAGRLEAALDASGRLGSVVLDGEEILAEPVRPTVWRAPIDNDGFEPANAGVSYHGKRSEWENLGLHSLIDRGTHLVTPDGVEIETRTTVTFQGDRVRVDEVIVVPDALDDLPRVGSVLLLVGGFETFTWYGLGPHENYSDRQSAAVIGGWSTTIDQQFVPYLHPQDHGNHGSVRWAELRRADGSGIRISATEDGPLLNVAARHHTDADLAAAPLLADLKARAETEVHIDLAIRGVGTGSCGPDTLPPYRITAGTHRWSFYITAVEATDRLR